MAFYTFHGVTLEVNQDCNETGDLGQLLLELSWMSTHDVVGKPSLYLSVHLNDQGLRVPPMAREVFRANGISGVEMGLEMGDDFYLTDGSSVLRLQSLQGKGDAHLAPAFFSKPSILQLNFWGFGLVKLLRPLGFYCLHAAGVVSPEGLGLLIIGEAGSGKSTLAIGLIQQGWSYLSDEAVLLRLQPEGVEALAFRKHFYIDGSAAEAYADLPLGEEVPDGAGGRKRRIRLEDAYPDQYLSRCMPRVLLFSRIVLSPHSTLLSIDRLTALKHLLVESGPQWFDKSTMGQHLEVLKRLVQQAATYELRAGLDLYRDPLTLVRLLAEAQGEDRWPRL